MSDVLHDESGAPPAPADLDERFREAVAAIDAGDLNTLERLLAADPRLVRERLESPGAWLREKVGRAAEPGEFFARPYLLWFVAEDPVRNGRLPRNIADVARAIIRAAKRDAAESLQSQLDTALRLAAWSWIARKCEVQITLIDALMDAGAAPGDLIAHDALINGNLAAAERLVDRGAKPTLASALCLSRWEDAAHLAQTADARERQVALALAALNGKAEALARLIALGADLNAFSTDIFTHGTALHHAVSSGSLDAVRILVEAGAKLGTKDRAWGGTPLDWAEHYIREAKDEAAAEPYREIAAYLRQKGAAP